MEDRINLLTYNSLLQPPSSKEKNLTPVLNKSPARTVQEVNILSVENTLTNLDTKISEILTHCEAHILLK